MTNLRINVTDILSNRYFHDVFGDEETAYRWLGSDGVNEPAILFPVAYRGKRFEEIAESMLSSKTKVNVETERILPFAKMLDRTYPAFLPVPPYRTKYAAHFTQAVTALENRPRLGISQRDLQNTAGWLRSQSSDELTQSKVFDFIEDNVAPRRQKQLKRLSDTCYYLAQGESLQVSHLSVSRTGAKEIDVLSIPNSAPDRLFSRGRRVEKVFSRLPGSVLFRLSARGVAKFRRHKAFCDVRSEMQKLTNGETTPEQVIKKLNDCTEPLR